MVPDILAEHFELLADAPGGVEKLRSMVLELAVRGKLAPQDIDDESASDLLAGKDKRPLTAGPYSIPETWCWGTLGDVAEIVMGNSPPGSSYNDRGEGVPLINGPVEFSAGPFGHTIKSKFTTEPTKFCESGDLLICVRGSTTGRTNIAVFDACIGRGVASIRPWIHQPYVNYVVLSMRCAIYESGTGSTFKSISQKQLAGYPIPVPPLAEQRRIVAKVDELMALCDEMDARQRARSRGRDRLVTASHAALTTAATPKQFTRAANRIRTHFDHLYATPQTVQQLRQTILQLAVQGKLVEQDPNDEPVKSLIGAIHAQKLKLVDAKAIPKPKQLPAVNPQGLPFDLPEGWAWIRLESVCEVITKGSSPKWQGVAYVTDPSKGILFITSENVGNYTIRKLDEPKYVESKFNEMETRSILQRGDILVNLVGASIGRSAIWDRDDVANINQAVGIVRFVRGDRSVNRRYLLHYLNSPTCLAIMFENQVETARANISLTNVKEFVVPIPPAAEQDRIVAKVDQLMTICDELESKLTQSQSDGEKLLEAIVHRLLNGAP